MKKIAALIGIFLLVISCSTDTEEPNVNYELVPIQNVIIGDELYFGDENIITIQYLKPSTCHGFNGFVYEKDAFTRTIGVQNYVVENRDCQAVSGEVIEKDFIFQPIATGMYTFKFWQGKDANGDNIFLELQREVVAQ
jgi:hypothetical protein